MKKIIYILLVLVFPMVSCSDKLKSVYENPYTEGSRKVEIQLAYPQGYTDLIREGVTVKISNPQTGVTYNLYTDKDGKVSIDLPYGFYRVSSSDKGEAVANLIPLFNKSIDELKVMDTSPEQMQLQMEYALSYSGQLVIKELYFAGCKGDDEVNFNYDKYVQIYNNSTMVAYLDSLCFGCIYNYNDLSSFTPWSYVNDQGQRVIRDTIPITEAIWQFPGRGTDFSLQPGESTVLALNGALDHTILRPQSVNLNVPGYFVCYNQRYTQTTYHPSPGQNLAGHWLDLLWKQGRSTAYAFSQTSPTAVLFRIKGTSAEEFINDENNRSKLPGSSSANDYIMIPSQWVLDGVEILSASTRFNRLPATIDAGAILFGAVNRNKGYTVHRKVDQEATSAEGQIIYMDTNNSSADFEIRTSQSIKD